MGDKELIQEIYNKYWEYMILKKGEELRELMSKDYYLLHMTGLKQNVNEFLIGLVDGTFNYYSAKHEEIDIHVNNNTATMIGKSRIEAAVYGGKKKHWKLKGDFTLRKEDEKWKLTSCKVSTY